MDENEKNTVELTGDASAIFETSAELSMSQRFQFSHFHITAAANLARQTAKVEQDFDGNSNTFAKIMILANI